MENGYAVLINDGMPQGKRLIKLNQIAIQQMQVLEDNSGRNLLKWMKSGNRPLIRETGFFDKKVTEIWKRTFPANVE